MNQYKGARKFLCEHILLLNVKYHLSEEKDPMPRIRSKNFGYIIGTRIFYWINRERETPSRPMPLAATMTDDSA